MKIELETELLIEKLKQRRKDKSVDIPKKTGRYIDKNLPGNSSGPLVDVNNLNLDKFQELCSYFRRGGLIHSRYFKHIILAVKELLSKGNLCKIVISRGNVAGSSNTFSWSSCCCRRSAWATTRFTKNSRYEWFSFRK